MMRTTKPRFNSLLLLSGTAILVAASSCGQSRRSSFSANQPGIEAVKSPTPVASDTSSVLISADSRSSSITIESQSVTPLPTATATATAIPCERRKLMIYSLQPAGSSFIYESLFSALVPVMNEKGFSTTFSNRKMQPTITKDFLSKYDIILFGSGCGGANGIPTQAEMAAMRDYYLSGGNLSFVTDDDFGDSNSPGSCNARMTPIVSNFGVVFQGNQDNATHGCGAVVSDHPILKGLKLGRYSSANMILTGNVAWGTDKPTMIGTLSNGAAAEALIEAKNGHGAILISPDFGSMSCDGPQYLSNVISHLGCKTK